MLKSTYIRIYFIILFLMINAFVYAQYPFEKYPAIKYKKKVNWTEYNRWDKEGKFHWTMSLPLFYKDNESLTVQITSFSKKENSLFRIYKNNKHLQTIFEPYAIGRNFGMLIDTIYIADINGDSLADVKICCWYGGCGIASLNERVVYLFQQPDNTFKKVSYIDMSPCERLERDIDGDGIFEIITMDLIYHKNHSYWCFNLFNYKDNQFINVNNKADYPIIIQYLFRENYKITNKISKEKMKSFAIDLPEYIDIR